MESGARGRAKASSVFLKLSRAALRVGEEANPFSIVTIVMSMMSTAMLRTLFPRGRQQVVAALARQAGVPAARQYSAAPAGGDFVLDFLKEDLAAYETYLEECRKVYYPLGESNDKNKVTKFAKDLEAARQKAKVPTTEERQKQLLGFFKWQAGDSVREFYNLAAPLMSPENASGAMLALDEQEKEIGGPLLYSDAKNFAAFQKKTNAIAKQYLDSVKEKTGVSGEEVLKNLSYYEAAAHLKKVEEDALDAVKRAKEGPRILDLSQLSDFTQEEMKKLKEMGGLGDGDLKDVDLDLKTIAQMLHKSRMSEAGARVAA